MTVRLLSGILTDETYPKRAFFKFSSGKLKVLKIFEDFSIIVLLCDIHRRNEWEIPHAVCKMCMLLIPLIQPYIIVIQEKSIVYDKILEGPGVRLYCSHSRNHINLFPI